MKSIKLRENLSSDTNGLILENFKLFAYPSTVDTSRLDRGEVCVNCCDELDKERIQRELFRNGCHAHDDWQNDLKLNFDADELGSILNDLGSAPNDNYYYVVCDDCYGGIDNTEFDNFNDAYCFTLDSMCDDNSRLSLFDTNNNRYITAVHRPTHPVEQGDCENKPYWDVQINEMLIEDEDFDESVLDESDEGKQKYMFIIWDKGPKLDRRDFGTSSDYDYETAKEARDAAKYYLGRSANDKRFKIDVVKGKSIYHEDYSNVNDDWGDPYTYKQYEDELKHLTNNFTDDNGKIECASTEEKNYCVLILRRHFKDVKVGNAEKTDANEGTWIISYSKELMNKHLKTQSRINKIE